MRRPILILFTLAFVVLLAVGGGFLYRFKKAHPEVKLNPQSGYLTEKAIFTISTKSEPLPFSTVKVTLKQNDKSYTLIEGPLKSFNKTLEVDLKKLGFGNGRLEAWAFIKTPFGKKEILLGSFTVDLTPPKVHKISKPDKVKIGKPAVFSAIITDNEGIKTAYLEVGPAKFPLLYIGNETYKTVFTAPLFLLKHPAVYKLVVEDKAGNKVENPIKVAVEPRRLRKKVIRLSEKEMEKLLSKFFPTVNNPVEQFKTVNEVYRKEDEKKFIEICSTSSAQMMANGTFEYLPHSAIKSYYGEFRIYYYKGKEIGTSIHKGWDLARYKYSPVPAANNGIVVFTGKTKVYGNVVIVDHGMGVFTLYAHLNDFTVKPGDYVKKGQIIGHTDTTGFALGDHLHFGVLVWGYATNPYYYVIPWSVNHYLYMPLKN